MLNRLRGGAQRFGAERREAGSTLIGVLICNLSCDFAGRPFRIAADETAARRDMSCRAARSARFLLAIAAGVLSEGLESLQHGGAISVAMAQELMTEPAAAASHVVFDIPAQPLAAALRAYSAATRIGVLVDGELTAGRSSAAVAGALSPEQALRTLLTGTGLIVRYAAPAAFTLVPAPADAPRSSSRDHSRDFLAVQTAVKRVLCQSEETQPGRYRMALQLWIDPSGTVVRSEFLSATSSRERDALVSAGLKNLTIEMAQPASLPQPVTVVVLPRAPGQGTDCVRRVTGTQR